MLSPSYNENMLAELRRLFYPHPDNNYKAGLLQPQGLSLLVGLFLLSQSLLNLSQGLMPGILGFASQIFPEEIVAITNQKRAESGLAPLKINPQLNEAARQKAADMFALNYWSHVSPRGVTPWTFITNNGYSYLYAGENLARDFSHSSGVVEAWMNSPTHRDNLLNPKYQEIGVAVVDGILQGQETTLVVQMFGAQLSRPAKISKRAAQERRTQEGVIGEKTANPTPTPTFFQEKETTPAAILAAPDKKISWLSSFDLTKSLSLAFAVFLFGILAIDGLIIYQKQKIRVSGHNFIHGTFMIILIVMIILSHRGLIL